MDNQENLSEKYIIDDLAEEAGGYFALPTEESLEYTNLLFSICDKYGIQYYKATAKEKYFVEEITRVTWAIEHGIDTKPAFVA